MGLNIDFGNVQPFEALPEGDYTFEIEDATVKPTKKDATKYNLVVKLTVDEPIEFNGKPHTEWVYINPDNPFGLQAFLNAVYQTELVAEVDLDQVLTEIVGMKVGGTVENGEYEGRTTASVKAWFAAA